MRGVYAQQDAEECFTALVQSLEGVKSEGEGVVEKYVKGKMRATYRKNLFGNFM